MGRIKENDYIGKQMVTLDIGAGVQPAVYTVQEPDVDPKVLAETLREKIEGVIKEVLGPTVEFSVPFQVRLTFPPRIIVPEEERFKELEDVRNELAEAFDEAEERRLEHLKNHPDNGKQGHWLVDGVRHHAIVRASSALEAIEKAKGKVGDWESPDASFIGEDMPEVY